MAKRVIEKEENLIFFFSSRRRHTRYWRDWSSDVCSSDLPAAVVGGNRGGRRSRGTPTSAPRPLRGRPEHPASARPARSEEGRVGEEGRSWWAADPLKKKRSTI